MSLGKPSIKKGSKLEFIPTEGGRSENYLDPNIFIFSIFMGGGGGVGLTLRDNKQKMVSEHFMIVFSKSTSWSLYPKYTIKNIIQEFPSLTVFYGRLPF